MREKWFERVLGPDRDDQPCSYHMAYVRRLSPLESTYTKERATDVCLETLKELGFDLAGDPNIKPDLDDRPAEGAARLRDRVRPADRRPPDHAGAGRAARLPGVPARGRPRAALRGLRPVAAVHVPPALARSRADGDLLVHRRGDLARARLARAPLRPLRRGGDARTPRRRRSSRRCCTAATRRSSTSSSTSGVVSTRTAGRPAGYAEKLTAATGVRYRSRRVHLRHGRRLLLGRLPAGLDPLVAAAREAGRGDRRGLVAERRDRRPPAGAVLRGHEAVERGDRRAARLRSARHRAAAARDRARRRKSPARGEVRRHAGDRASSSDMRAAVSGDLERARARREADPWREPEPRPRQRPTRRCRRRSNLNRSPTSCPSLTLSRSRSPHPGQSPARARARAGAVPRPEPVVTPGPSSSRSRSRSSRPSRSRSRRPWPSPIRPDRGLFASALRRR